MAKPLFPEGVPTRKRFFDLLLAIPGIILISPFLAIIALLIRVQMGSPVIFRQSRPGLHGKLFSVFKFRTMIDAYDHQREPLPDEERLTGLGRFLRSFSIDELPELLNVLAGEMSLVGPRPLLTRYLERYSPEQARRHEVLPGMTGWAQVNGRNAITWEDKFRFDVWYVDNWSLRLDAKILVLTLLTVIRREGISQPGFSTSEEFMGNKQE
ncbi:MAG: sugar transferase [Anaerolineales bacterium]|nr:sugar transferase [Anaerolineales bacterium]